MSKTNRYAHITTVLKALHWLPLRFKIHFKILILTYKAQNELAPSYIGNMLQSYHPARTLRAASSNLLLVPQTRLKTFSHWSFQCIAPTAWNQLPDMLRYYNLLNCFKSNLKTHLFQHCIFLIFNEWMNEWFIFICYNYSF